MLLALAVALVLPARAQLPSQVPSPEQFFGFPMGADRRLAHWDQMVDYFYTVEERSDRVVVEELGRTTLGHPYLLATISTPDTIAELPRYQAMQKKLADPRRTTPEEAEAIARSGKAVVLIGANVHATEIGTSQLMNALFYQLATEQSAWVRHLLDNTIILLIPSENPDGQRMVVNWYRRNLGTQYEGSRLPELYHPYAGHDNNRDSYMLTQVETQHLNRVLYQQWLPEVYLDVHQMGSSDARIFVPPFKNPANPNVDPLVWSQVNILGQAMAAKLHESDKPDVIWGELYSGYWQGANNTNPWWHNMVSLLTEVASAQLATPVLQEPLSTDRLGRVSRGSGRLDRLPSSYPLGPPRDVQFRMNYPKPWPGGRWTLGDVLEYGRLATHGLLEHVANNRLTLKRNFYLMNQRAIDRFADGNPYAFLIPAEQRDPGAVAKLIRLLQAEAADVEVAKEPFEAEGRAYPAGTYLLRLSQPFGRWVKDILEPQTYPDVQWPAPSTAIGSPYDVTAWSLGMLMGVETVQVELPFEAETRLLTTDAEAPPGRVVGEGNVYSLSHDANQSFTALNRLHASGAAVSWVREAIALEDGRRYSPGAMVITGVDQAVLLSLARDLHLEFIGTELPDGLPMLPITPPRLAVYEPWGGNMDAGWTRWVLDQHEFSYTHLRSADVRDRNLYERFDVIILPEMESVDLIRGLQGPNTRPQYRGGIEAGGIRSLRQFVEDGGTLITLGNSADFATEHLSTPVINVVRDVSQESFYCPGTILRVSIDTTHPIGYGMPATADAMVVSNGGFRPSRRLDSAGVRTIVRYPGLPLLRSGWIVGEERLRGAGAVMEVPSGKGRIILHTFRVQHRGQTWGTFKLLFNSIFYGPAMSGRPPVETSFNAQ